MLGIMSVAQKQFNLSSGTFKIQKTRLQREGYDPRLTTDQIYFLNARTARYEAIDEELFNGVVEGRMSLWHFVRP